MTCVDAIRLVDAYVDDELDAAERARFRTHVDTCAQCGRAVDRRVALQGTIRGVPYYAAPDRLRAAVIARLAEGQKNCAGNGNVTPGLRRRPLQLSNATHFLPKRAAQVSPACGIEFRQSKGRMNLDGTPSRAV